MKIVIAGSRTIEDPEFVFAYIDEGLKVLGIECTEVVSGVARGVDRLGEEWAKKHDIPIQRFHANWEKEGKAAGPIRNKKMAEYADAGIILNEGMSRGSENMRSNLLKLEKRCVVFMFHNYLEVDRELDGDYIGVKMTLRKYLKPENAIWDNWNKPKGL